MTHSWQMVVTTPSPNTLSRAWPLLYRPSRIFWTKQISKNELVLSQSPLATTLLLSLGISMIEHFLDWEFWRLLFAHMDKDEAAHQKVQWLICIPNLLSSHSYIRISKDQFIITNSSVKSWLLNPRNHRKIEPQVWKGLSLSPRLVTDTNHLCDIPTT